MNDDLQDECFNIGFLKLDFTEAEVTNIGELRHLNRHCCPIISIDENTLFNAYLEKLHEVNLNDQNQMPDITVIN